jgi:NTP pyrophosphatase (non-canonical NTP hydrolase)
MQIKEAQQIVNDWILNTGKGYFSPLTNMVLLTEEVGEVARVIARKYGDQVAKESDLHVKLSEELADALWVIICLANQTGIDLEEALLLSLDKKNRRDANRF